MRLRFFVRHRALPEHVVKRRAAAKNLRSERASCRAKRIKPAVLLALNGFRRAADSCINMW